MTLSLKSISLHSFLFTLCVIVPYFNNYELSFLIWLVVAVISLRKQYSRTFLTYWAIFVFLLLFAFLVGCFFEYSLYFIVRDVTYMLKPVLGLMIGYQLFHKGIEKPFRFLVYSGVAMAAIHLVMVAYGIFLQGAANVREIREYGGYFNDYEVYALLFLLFNKQFDLGLTARQRRNFLILLGVSSFFYLARTNFLQFAILYMGMKGYLLLNKRALKIIFSSLVAIILAYTAIYYYNPVRNGEGLDEFLYKIKMAPGEAFSTKINRDDWKDFNDNYRSYENIRTIQQLNHNETWCFGEGIGSQVDLKQKVYLGDMELRLISILHNGFMTVLLKTGLLGLGVYVLSILFFFFNGRPQNQELMTLKLLFIGTGVFLVLSNWVFMGVYNLLDSKSLLIGFLFAYKNQLVQRKP